MGIGFDSGDNVVAKNMDETTQVVARPILHIIYSRNSTFMFTFT